MKGRTRCVDACEGASPDSPKWRVYCYTVVVSGMREVKQKRTKKNKNKKKKNKKKKNGGRIMLRL